MSIVQRIAGCATRTPPGGIEPTENANQHCDSDGGDEKLRVQLWFEQSAHRRCGNKELHPEHADERSTHAAKKPEQSRFPQDHPDDSAAFPTDREEHTNLV